MDKQIYDTRVVPFVIHQKEEKNGLMETRVVENLTQNEIDNMSCDPRMLWRNNERIYMAEMPLAFNEGTSVKWSLYYLFDELTIEEQEKYLDRSIIIPTTIEKVVKVYDEKSKSFFGKIRSKKKRR